MKKVISWTVAALIVVIVGGCVISCGGGAEKKIEIAKEYIENEDFESAKNELKDFDESHSLYSEAKSLLHMADSMILKRDFKANISKELKSIDSFDFSKLRGSINNIEKELAQFVVWADYVEKGEESDDEEVQEIARLLKEKLKKVQAKEYPLLREEYVNIVSKKMWEEGIEVRLSGTRNKNITFTCFEFVDKERMKVFQEKIDLAMHNFRFNKIQYRCHRGQQKYENYIAYEGDDSDRCKFGE